MQLLGIGSCGRALRPLSTAFNWHSISSVSPTCRGGPLAHALHRSSQILLPQNVERSLVTFVRALRFCQRRTGPLSQNVRTFGSTHSTQSQQPGTVGFLHQDPPDDEAKKARARLFVLLNARPYPESALREKLSAKGFTERSISWSLASVKELGVQSDSEYACAYARTKWRNARWAPRRIASELRRKDISEDVIREALDWLRTEAEESLLRRDSGLADAEDDDSEEGATGDAMFEQLLSEARKRVATTASLPFQTRRRRLVMWLQRTGHDWDTVVKILDSLQGDGTL